jgi:hypothetical protein
MAIAILAVLGSGLQNVILTLAITGWVAYARVVRGEVLSVREKEFVLAARCVGVGHVSIMLRHILPNVMGSIIVIASFAVAGTILTEAALSFLGLSVGPDVPTWGGMVAAGRDQIITGKWWIYAFPGLAIMLTVLGINLIGDWLRDALDPRLKLWPSRSAAQGGVQRVAQPIAQQVEPDHRQHDRDAREQDQPGRGAVVGLALVDHAAPAWRRRLDADPQEAQRRFRQDHGAGPDRHRDDDQPEHVRQQVTEDDANVGGAHRARRLDVFALAEREEARPHDARDRRP